MSRTRRLGIVMSVLSAAILVGAAVEMSRRISSANRQAPPPTFAFRPILQRQFDFAGRAVSLTDGEARGDRAVLHVVFGGAAHEVLTVPPVLAGLSDLGGYGEWLKVLAFEEYGPRGPGVHSDQAPAQAGGRLVIVVRNPAPHVERDTWGTVKRRHWTFDLHELKADGAIEVRTFRFPIVSDYPVRLETLPEELRTLPELSERSWEFYAALHAMPPLQVPKFKFKDDAFSRLGWTLPVSAFAGLGLTAGVLLIFAPERRRRTAAASE